MMLLTDSNCLLDILHVDMMERMGNFEKEKTGYILIYSLEVGYFYEIDISLAC
jgi:hypothetical protein